MEDINCLTFLSRFKLINKKIQDYYFIYFSNITNSINVNVKLAHFNIALNKNYVLKLCMYIWFQYKNVNYFFLYKCSNIIFYIEFDCIE